MRERPRLWPLLPLCLTLLSPAAFAKGPEANEPLDYCEGALFPYPLRARDEVLHLPWLPRSLDANFLSSAVAATYRLRLPPDALVLEQIGWEQRGVLLQRIQGAWFLSLSRDRHPPALPASLAQYMRGEGVEFTLQNKPHRLEEGWEAVPEPRDLATMELQHDRAYRVASYQGLTVLSVPPVLQKLAHEPQIIFGRLFRTWALDRGEDISNRHEPFSPERLLTWTSFLEEVYHLRIIPWSERQEIQAELIGRPL